MVERDQHPGVAKADPPLRVRQRSRAVASKVPAPQNINSRELSNGTRKIFWDGDIRCPDYGQVERVRSDLTIADHLEVFIRIFRDRDRMNSFGVVMNEGEAEVSVLDDEIPCSQTGEEVISAEMGNDRGSSKLRAHGRLSGG